MSWLLDTNVISELIRPQPNVAVVRWLAERSGEEGRLYLSALTLAEIRRGVLRLDSQSRLLGRLQAWLNKDLAVRFAGLPKGVVVSTMDSLIGATTLHHGLILATRNEKDLRHLAGLALEDPWR